MNDISLNQYSILSRLFVQSSWNIGKLKCCYVWRTSKYVYRVLYHHDINDVFSLRKIKRFMWFFFFPRTLKQRIRYWLYCIQHELWCCLEWVWDFNPKEEKEGWVDGMVSNRVQRLAVSPCFDPEPSALCRTADCEGQYNPQCLALQRLIKYLMC